jgi:hypothetical protein
MKHSDESEKGRKNGIARVTTIAINQSKQLAFVLCASRGSRCETSAHLRVAAYNKGKHLVKVSYRECRDAQEIEMRGIDSQGAYYPIKPSALNQRGALEIKGQ